MIFEWIKTRVSGVHLSADLLTRLACRELSAEKTSAATAHMQRCPLCCRKYQRIADAFQALQELHDIVVHELGATSGVSRANFIRRLARAMDAEPVPTVLGKFWIERNICCNVSLASALGATLTTLLVIFMWRGPVTAVSAAEFLDRAVASQGGVVAEGSRVFRQRIQIRTARRTINRSIYQGYSTKGEEKTSRLDPEDRGIAAALTLAGVDWDAPLSPLSFKAWHDRQIHPKDSIQSQSDEFLTISTRVDSSDITCESLTVRKQSFHPVQRTIEYRRAPTVSIAEVGIESLSRERGTVPLSKPGLKAATAPNATSVEAASAPLTLDLDNAELRARLLLNELHADTGEELKVSRDAWGVRVDGVVEGEGRKRELNGLLQGLPLLTARIQSFDDLKQSRRSREMDAPVRHLSVQAVVSPLEEYFGEKQRSREDLSRISIALFDTTVDINRTSRLITEIEERFSKPDELSPTALRDRNELVTRLGQRLLGEVNRETELVEEIGLRSSSSGSKGGAGTADLMQLAHSNTAAAEQLISGKNAEDRSAEELVIDLMNATRGLRAAALVIVESGNYQP